MGASEWLVLDKALGWAEVALVAAGLAYLVVALVRNGRKRARRALILAGVVAVTIAQPFGVKGAPISPSEFAAGNPRPAKAEAVHSVRILGIPLFGFRPYTRGIFYVSGEGGYPTDWLKLRSWLWPGLLTNGEKLERLCGTTDQPCWSPEDQSQAIGRSSNLQLVRAGDEWRYRILRSDGSAAPYPGPREGTYSYNGYYRLTVGLDSGAGLVYWLLAGALGGALMLRIRRRGPSSEAHVVTDASRERTRSLTGSPVDPPQCMNEVSLFVVPSRSTEYRPGALPFGGCRTRLG